jgi:nitrogen fixation-related uncharacterized protein
MSFVRFWIGFTAFGLAVTVLLLLWAVRRRQFKESDRAGYLPLADLALDGAGDDDREARAGGRRTALALAGVMGIGLLALAASVVVSLTAAP